jgi:hypothetical protein
MRVQRNGKEKTKWKLPKEELEKIRRKRKEMDRLKFTSDRSES